MTITAVELHRLAESLNVRIVRHDNGPPGWYNHDKRIISTRRGQSITQYCSALAHAYYGDTPTGNGHFDQRQEHRVDQFAARLLINAEEFENAAIWHQGHLPAIADELEVAQRLLKVWLRNTELAA
ncbi:MULTISPECIES: hypothetical protein [Corynebacterium]|uniref:hypothetical protein n=1 Tax=Corynebacterium TaxID=1716 RepID=UPI00047E59E1|nr:MULTISPECIES: hypothetical protein [Corynebacterium]OBA54603.1 hypothetical protein A5774_04505 [Corynebacterium sp. EPI-003-04-2554_SCH2473622]